MKKIPLALRAQLDADPWMHRCCITGRKGPKIDWHHALIFAGSQVNEVWTILPLVREIHDRVNEAVIKELCDWIMLSRATDDDVRRYSKVVNLQRRKEYLVQKYGTYKNDFIFNGAQDIAPRPPRA